MTNEHEVIAEVERALQNAVESDIAITATTPIDELDSLVATTVLVSLEDHFRVRLDDLDRDRIRNVGQLAREVASRVDAKDGAR